MRAPPTTTLDGDGDDGPRIRRVHIFQAGFVDVEVAEEVEKVDLSPGGPMSPQNEDGKVCL